MQLEAFLAARHTSSEAVAGQARQLVAAARGELLLAVGSLVEGLGTAKSDLDLLLLARRDPRELPEDLELSWASGECLVDMRIMPQAETERLMNSFAEWAAAPWDPSRAAPFPLEKRTLLHRIAHGVAIDGGDDGAIARPPIDALARLKLHAARHEARTVQVDMAGLLGAGDARSLGFAALQLLGLASDALLAGHHRTNPLPKWRLRLLSDLPEGWTAALGPHRSRPAAEILWDLSRLPRASEIGEVLRFAHRAAAFARAAFAWSEDVLLRAGRLYPDASPPAAGSCVVAGAGAALPPMDFDIDFAVCADGALVGRLNAFGEPLSVTPGELAALLLFDGETTHREAQAWVEARHGTRLDCAALEARLAARGLLAGPVAFAGRPA